MANPSDTTPEKVEQPSFLEMSDEDILKAGPPTMTAEVVEATPVVTEVVAEATATQEEAPPVVEGNADEGAGDKPSDEAAADETKADDKTVVEKPATGDKTVVEKPAEVPADKAKETPAAIDFEAEYKRLLAPFKANGREIKVDSVDDAVALMQMGANYNKKMAALKPNLKLMKMLENNGFLNEEKIGFLIDLGKKNPAAISKLVKDSGVDPMDLDAEKASAYKQTAYAVDDREIELDTVLDELQGTDTYTRTLDVVSNKWDVASKQVISQSPQLLRVLNDHMASGIYDLISTEVEREKMLGRLKGLSEIEAYRQVGDSIQARGGFDHFSKVNKPPVTPEIVQPKAKAVDDDALKDKRRAASSTKTAPPTLAPKAVNTLGMSDEEFSKLPPPNIA
jgi:hypothetical protein